MSTTTALPKKQPQCPMVLHSGNGTTNQDWWPHQLTNLKLLARNENPNANNPLVNYKNYNYAKEFSKLDLPKLQADLQKVMTTSQDWWPADYGHYGPFFIRMAWHSAGTYRSMDGRGGGASGELRLAPLNSWPDNANLDKARRLLWPLKQQYGRSISWADLMILAGTVALQDMGLPIFGFAGGRMDTFAPSEDVNWGQETTWLSNQKRYHPQDDTTSSDSNHNHKVLTNPLGAVQMGLIYVNPEGPNGNPNPLLSALDIRETFGRMGMNDEETVALIAGGHSFGKCHGAATPEGHVGREPEGAPIEQQGLGWNNTYASGNGSHTITSGLEGAWTYEPTKWNPSAYLNSLFTNDWELTKSPAGAHQWKPKTSTTTQKVPDAHDPNKHHDPFMLTSDLALKMDPIYKEIAQRFWKHPQDFEQAFAKAWYKLTHRDMGPYPRLLGPMVPPPQPWQDYIPPCTVPLTDLPLSNRQVQDQIKQAMLTSGISIDRLVTTAWASAFTYRQSDKRGGANGGRLQFEPQCSWAVNEPFELQKVLNLYKTIQAPFDAQNQCVSMADLIVLGGCVGIEAAAKAAGHDVQVPFTPGRMDATIEMTDVESMQVLEPMADGFRNYLHPDLIQQVANVNETENDGTFLKPEELLVDKSYLLGLTAPEMTALIGGMRVLGIGTQHSNTSCFTHRVGQLTNDFFVNLLDPTTTWTQLDRNYYEGRDATSGQSKWTATRIDLIFGSHSVLRAISEVYASNDAEADFVKTFCNAFAKVMELDRLDLNPPYNNNNNNMTTSRL